jgi:hypothetical protein
MAAACPNPNRSEMAINMMQRKSKIVSFRLSPEEYRRLNAACELQGIGSISELARTALQPLMTPPASNGHGVPEEISLTHKLDDLLDRVQSLSAEIERLAGRLNKP